MNISLKLLLPILMITLMHPALAKTKYSSSVQTTVTSGKNNGFDDTYVGLWLLGKASIGLTRNSRAFLSIKAGGQNHDESVKNKTDLELQASYIFQPNSGYFSPTYALKFLISQEDFSSSTTDKNSISVSMYKPISNKMEYGLTYRLTNKSSSSEIDTQSFIVNLDYIYNSKTTLYSTFMIADEETEITVTAQDDQINNVSARTDDTSGGHAPGEPGYHGPALAVGNNLSNSDNTSIIIGTVYSIDANQFIDVAFIKHFYDTSAQGNTSSRYLALDYFYKF